MRTKQTKRRKRRSGGTKKSVHFGSNQVKIFDATEDERRNAVDMLPECSMNNPTFPCRLHYTVFKKMEDYADFVKKENDKTSRRSAQVKMHYIDTDRLLQFDKQFPLRSREDREITKKMRPSFDNMAKSKFERDEKERKKDMLYGPSFAPKSHKDSRSLWSRVFSRKKKST